MLSLKTSLCPPHCPEAVRGDDDINAVRQCEALRGPLPFHGGRGERTIIGMAVNGRARGWHGAGDSFPCQPRRGTGLKRYECDPIFGTRSVQWRPRSIQQHADGRCIGHFPNLSGISHPLDLLP